MGALVLTRLMYAFQDSSDGNTTVSVLAFRPRLEDIGKRLICRVTNTLMEEASIADRMDLKIDCELYCFSSG